MWCSMIMQIYAVYWLRPASSAFSLVRNARTPKFQLSSATVHSLYCDNKLMVWPPCSPDLDPIENLWSIIKQQLILFPSFLIDRITKRYFLDYFSNLLVVRLIKDCLAFGCIIILSDKKSQHVLQIMRSYLEILYCLSLSKRINDQKLLQKFIIFALDQLQNMPAQFIKT